MKKCMLIFFSVVLLVGFTQAQNQSAKDSMLLLIINQQIDNFVVLQNTEALDKLYADDFSFSHGSGRIEGKAGWFTSVAKGRFVSRKHDSVTVKFHPDAAIVRGKLSVHKTNRERKQQIPIKKTSGFMPNGMPGGK